MLVTIGAAIFGRKARAGGVCRGRDGFGGNHRDGVRKTSSGYEVDAGGAGYRFVYRGLYRERRHWFALIGASAIIRGVAISGSGRADVPHLYNDARTARDCAI